MSTSGSGGVHAGMGEDGVDGGGSGGGGKPGGGKRKFMTRHKLERGTIADDHGSWAQKISEYLEYSGMMRNKVYKKYQNI